MSELVLTKQEMIKLNGMVKEAVDSLIRSEAEKSLRKDIADRVKEELNFKPAMFNAVVMERYNDSITEKLAKLEEIVDFNDQIIAAAKGTTV
jgi:hypothetical protein